jgi:hypothetical protein
MLRMLEETGPALHPSNDFNILRRLCGAGVLPIHCTAKQRKMITFKGME